MTKTKSTYLINRNARRLVIAGVILLVISVIGGIIVMSDLALAILVVFFATTLEIVLFLGSRYKSLIARKI